MQWEPKPGARGLPEGRDGERQRRRGRERRTGHAQCAAGWVAQQPYPDLLGAWRGGGDVSAQGGGGLARLFLCAWVGWVTRSAREMSDFDSNPFADPDLNNPFKVSVVPSLSRRKGSWWVETDKFLRARPSAPLGRLDRGSGPPHSFRGSRPGPRATGLGVGAEPLPPRVRAPFPTSPAEEPGSGPEGSRPSARSGPGGSAGQVELSPARQARPARPGPGGGGVGGGRLPLPWGCHGDPRRRRGALPAVMAEVCRRGESTEYAAIKKNKKKVIFLFL